MPKWELIVRRKPNLQEAQAEVHSRLVAALESLPSPWTLSKPLAFTSSPANLSTTISLRGKLGKGISGYANYVLRSKEYWEDSAQFDDHFVFEFDPIKIDLVSIPQVVLPRLVEDLGAYRAAVIDSALANEEWPEIAKIVEKTGRDIDGRHGVYRFSPIAYYDESLLECECKISASKLSSKVSGVVKQFFRGIVINSSASPTDANFIAGFDQDFRRLAAESSQETHPK